MSDHEQRVLFNIDREFAQVRLDKALATLLPEHSRATIQNWLQQSRVKVDGEIKTQKFRLRGGERLEIHLPDTQLPLPQLRDLPPQPVAFEVVYRDTDLLVINKPAGLTVHPGAGQADQTLLNGLLHLDHSLRALPRAGIVHRLDKDTTGLMVVARNQNARQHLIAQLAARSVTRKYLGVVHGVLVAGETIAQPIGRHPRDRTRMCVIQSGKPALTHLRVAQKFRAHTLLRAELESGRTHQIRVHLNWRGFPLVGDKRYGGRARKLAQAHEALNHLLENFPRQALHATELALIHPTTGATHTWQQPPPADLCALIDALRCDNDEHAGF